ncbi:MULTISPECIES: transposase [unclassified Undibacterium]|nr:MULTISPECIES: transposase [unclassified Undibacterium]MEB0217404.1 transposase [Undibacterium sp. 5I2]WPX43463.1 transposase [Undibacterium sp. CCC3.4]
MSSTRKLPSPDDAQYNLFGGVPSSTETPRLRTALSSGRRFVTGDARAIFLGPVRLEDHLKHAGHHAAFSVARLLEEQNWLPFEQRYAATGRAPYAPQLMLGLILYGVMQGVHSLRELERMARLDLGCMWVTGGIAPDHANIGRFIVLHEASLTEEFFESLTRSILKATGSDSTRLAGDGTVIEAACSHYNLLKEEAVKARAIAARQALESMPQDLAAQQEQERSAHCQELFEQRQAARRASGKSSETLRISGGEPEAMVQRLKRGRGFAASYKPSVLANEDRIVTAFALDPSSETKVIAPMLDQSARVTSEHAKELLLDAGYFDDDVINATLERDISLLCPDGQWPAKSKEGGLYHKSAFDYDLHSDTYRCPAGQTLILISKCGETPSTRSHDVYAASNCNDCKLRANCTKAIKGRCIKRYREDEQREALRLVMRHRQARRIFSQRKAIVEPVFSSLRGQQGVERFRRRGLKAVKRELALHVMAHNLSRAVALLRALFLCFYSALYALRVAAKVFSIRMPQFFCLRLQQLHQIQWDCASIRFATASEGRGFKP